MAHALYRHNSTDDSDKDQLYEIIKQQLRESHAPLPQWLTLDTTLGRDLGLDSLNRVELVSRIEQSFNIGLPDYVAINAETPRDLLREIRGAHNPEPSRWLSAHEPFTPETTDTTENLNAPYHAVTLSEALLWHVQHHPDRPHIHLHNDHRSKPITYQHLHRQAKQIAAGLQALDIQPGDTVSIMLPTSAEYFYCFFGILLAGGIPVPLYPPANPAQLEDHMRRHVGILNNCQAPLLITVPEAKKIARLLQAQVATLRHVSTVDELYGKAGSFIETLINPQATAFIQYTSGSTGKPKGVVLSHANLLANIMAMGQTINATKDDVFVSWLPLYHDMGLIGAWLGSVYYGYLLAVMSPLAFLHHPEKWLWSMHQFKGTLSASPNFGYELCIRRLQDHQLQDLDLSRWRAAFNGAETVSVSTMERFYRKFHRYGLKRQALMPVYGLAENSLGLTFPPLNRGLSIDKIKRAPFMNGGKAMPATPGEHDPLQFVSCGFPLKGHQVRVVDSSDRQLPDRQQGHIQFRGPSSTSGYYRNAADTKRLFHDDWLDSGDLGYIADGEVYVTGRLKDIIIRAGRNIYPHELEECVGNIDGVRTGRVAAFGSIDPQSGTEKLVIVAETRITDATELGNLRHKLISVVNGLAGTPPDEIVFAPPNTILKTSSGKLRRAASRQLYEKGQIGKGRKAIWLQILHFAAKGFTVEVRKLADAATRIVFGVFTRGMFWSVALGAWLGILVLPTINTRFSFIRKCTSLLAALSGTPVKIHGLQNLPPQTQPCVYVANHASYLDAMVVIHSLPRTFRFVAKAELKQSRLAKIFFDRLNVDYIERFDMEKSLEDLQRLSPHTQHGDNLLFFPEGTFFARPGLQPFHLGAFMVASTANVPVVPISIRGTRSMLRADTWLPSRGAIQVIVSEPITPQQVLQNPATKLEGPGKLQDRWALAKALRDAAREKILKSCGEPDLGLDPSYLAKP